jgi:inorganic pyrophosphatase
MDAQTAQWMDALIRENTEELEVIVEIPKGSHVKYEYDKKTQRIICDRILSTPFFYFFNYGYVPNTLSEDGDPLDVVLLMEDSLFPGCSIRCRVLGVLETSDEKGTDPKLIVCPISRIDSFYDHLKDVMDVSVGLLNKIKHFFEHYKDLEPGKWVKFIGWGDAAEARRLIQEAIERAKTA